jgi:hypothetical protein
MEIVPKYAIGLWLASLPDDSRLQQFIIGDGSSDFAGAINQPLMQSDFVEAIFYAHPTLIFDAIDKVSYAKYFRSECVKMLYPQQFANYNSLIVVYAKSLAHQPIHPFLFADGSKQSMDDRLRFIGILPFVID